MASNHLIVLLKRLTLLFFIVSIALPVHSLYNRPLQHTGNNFIKATYRLVASLDDPDKMEAISEKSKMRRFFVGLRNYVFYLLYERQIKSFTLHENRWMDWAGSYRFQRQHNMVPLTHVEKLAKFFKAHRVPWVVIGLPNKCYIYPEKAGLRVLRNSGEKERFLASIRKNPDIRYVDAYSLFRQYRHEYLLFNGIEHHSNNIGNYLAFSLLTKEMHAIFKDQAPVLDEGDIVAVNYKTINSRDSNDEFGRVPSNFIRMLDIEDFGIEYPYGYATIKDSFLDKQVEIYNYVTAERLLQTNQEKKFDRRLFGKREIISLTRCPDSLTPLKILAIGNSNKPGLAIYFTRYFNLTVSKYYATDGYHFDYEEEVALYEDFVERFGPPDVVIGVY